MTYSDFIPVLQHQRPERFRGHSTPESSRSAARQAQRALPPRQSDDELFLGSDPRAADLCLRSYILHLIRQPVLLQQVADVDHGNAGSRNEGAG
jgi:hypothetical protein